MLIKVGLNRSETADTRTCNVKEVTRDQLLESSFSHKSDVIRVFESICQYLSDKAHMHDFSKITRIDWFYSDFIRNFESTGWYRMHVQAERHHLTSEDGIPLDVDLFDLLEHLVDNVTSCVARTGNKDNYIPSDLPSELLQRVVKNTEKKLLDTVMLA